ncbi:glycosyltransferase [Mycobacterium phage Demsculpinboyz]|uniref:Glycosyltransferase n=1 Tax=Mycobacterium phage Demsculpinboyz TaxID=2041528 RepID=A0A2D1GAF7_9CAUD|nr:glycosyltransferase [Mycobacterium phage Demsculpinboyz]ATN88710.1 glycosyltransferase [Mycobacterium phage Demsculpinboyz]
MNSKPPDLSILICSVSERHDNFAIAIQRQIYNQIAKLDDPTRVEVLVLTDTRSMSIGTKRNHLVRMASGRYTVFVDDDDEVADNYVSALLKAAESGADVLTFQLEYRLNGIKRWITRQSIRYTDDHVNKLNTPRHTSAVRRDIALALPFVESSYGEDADWAKRLLSVAKTERVINEALYIYCDVPATSVARQYAAEHSPNAYRQWLDAQPKQDYSLGRRLGNQMTSTLQHALSLQPKGTALEFGVGQGKTLRMIAQQMPVVGFDSFQGLPDDWEPGRFEKGHFACEPPQVDNATLVVGLFEDTLPTFTFPDDIGLVHIDCDLYSSTMTVLNHLEPHLRPGCILVFDEYHGAQRCVDHEQRAFRECAERTGIKWTVIGHGPEQWSIRLS